MTKIEPGDDAFPAASTISEVEAVLLDLKAELLDLQDRLRDGEFAAVKEATRLAGELRTWLKIALDLETIFHERQRKQAGYQRGYAVDFDAARDQIRCRLDRLRRCGYSQKLPR